MITETENTTPLVYYVGNLQHKTRKSGEVFLAGNICIDSVETVPSEYLYIEGGNVKTGRRRCLKIFINPYKEGPNEYGNTHSISVGFNNPSHKNSNKQNKMSDSAETTGTGTPEAGTSGTKYLGSAQERTRASGDKFFTGSLCIDDLESVSPDLIHKGKNGKRYLRIVVNPYRNGANEYGSTHSIAVDTYKKEG